MEKIFSILHICMTHYLNPNNMTRRHVQVIKGTILGGSSIICPKNGRNCYLSMRSKNGLWMDYKLRELTELASPEPLTLEKTNRWHSLSYPIFSDLYQEFYQNGKRNLKENALESLSDVAFAIWLGDAGKIRDEELILNTNIWGKKGNKLIIDYFNSLEYKTEIIKERKSLRVKLDKSSTKKFLNLAVPHLPVFML